MSSAKSTFTCLILFCFCLYVTLGGWWTPMLKNLMLRVELASSKISIKFGKKTGFDRSCWTHTEKALCYCVYSCSEMMNNVMLLYSMKSCHSLDYSCKPRCISCTYTLFIVYWAHIGGRKDEDFVSLLLSSLLLSLSWSGKFINDSVKCWYWGLVILPNLRLMWKGLEGVGARMCAQLLTTVTMR